MKIIYTLIIITGLYSLSSAQDNMRVFVGFNITNTDYHLKNNLTGSDSSGLRRENYLLPNCGFDLDFKLGKRLSTGIGFGVTVMGSRNYNTNFEDIENLQIDPDLRIGYLRFPFMLKYEIFNSLKIIGGYSLNYSFRKNQNFFAYEPGGQDLISIYNNVHHGLLLGASYTIKNICFEVNYHKGISKIWDTKDFDPDQRAFLTMGGFQFSVGFLIHE